MQYLLTSNEYHELKDLGDKELAAIKATLQDLCTKVADHMPVKWGWGPPYGEDGKSLDVPKPWGCILSTDREWYCDKCPVRQVCPYERKNWSK